MTGCKTESDQDGRRVSKQCQWLRPGGSEPCFGSFPRLLRSRVRDDPSLCPGQKSKRISQPLKPSAEKRKFSESVAWEQLQPAPGETARGVRAADLAEGVSKQWLTHPGRCLLAGGANPRQSGLKEGTLGTRSLRAQQLTIDGAVQWGPGRLLNKQRLLHRWTCPGLQHTPILRRKASCVFLLQWV